MLADVVAKDFHLVNAINLDGGLSVGYGISHEDHAGGSSLTVINGTLVNSPSDQCGPTECMCPSSFTQANTTLCTDYCKTFRSVTCLFLQPRH